MTATCKTCGGRVPDGHVPSLLDPQGIGHPNHSVQAADTSLGQSIRSEYTGKNDHLKKPVGELDDKLQDLLYKHGIIGQQFEIVFHDIKQAFHDAGYMQPTRQPSEHKAIGGGMYRLCGCNAGVDHFDVDPKSYADGYVDSVKDGRAHNEMTGQEWYARFEKELAVSEEQFNDYSLDDEDMTKLAQYFRSDYAAGVWDEMIKAAKRAANLKEDV